MLVLHQFPCGGSARPAGGRSTARGRWIPLRCRRKRKNWFLQSGFQETAGLGGKMRIAQSKPLVGKDFFAAECGQSTQIITVAECRSDLFQTGISLSLMQRASKTAEKDDNRCFPLWQISLIIDQNQQKQLSVAAFSKTNPGSLGHLAVGKGAKVSTRRRLTSSSSVSVPTSTRKSLEVDGGGVEGSSGRVPWYRPALQQCRALGITTSRCPSPGRGGPPVLSLSSVTFKWFPFVSSGSLQAHKGRLLCLNELVKSLASVSVLELNLSFFLHWKRDNRYS